MQSENKNDVAKSKKKKLQKNPKKSKKGLTVGGSLAIIVDVAAATADNKLGMAR